MINNEKNECAVIRDLMPTYADGLASKETKKIVETHIAECEECRNILIIMQEPQENTQEKKNEKIEIDFLKKNHKRTRNIIRIIIIAALLLLIIGIKLYPYIARQELSYEELNIDLSVGDITVDNVDVEDGNVHMIIKAYGTYGIARVDFEEQDGILNIKVMGAKEGIWAHPTYETSFHTDHTITRILLGDDILWDSGVTISNDIIRVYKTKHPYVGNHVQNGDTLSALKISDTLGGYTMELQTSKEPYGMKINLKKAVEEKQEAYFESCMRYYAYVSLALIDNLSYVSFEYEINGQRQEKSWSMEDAKAELGKSIKDYGSSEARLQQLKWELSVLI